jgi:hypothetical protein
VADVARDARLRSRSGARCWWRASVSIRKVARIFVGRREFPVPDVIEAIRKFAQPELLTSSNQTVSNVPFGTSAAPVTSTIITPIARTASVA